MLVSDIAIAQFTSKTSSAGDVFVQLGFVPSFAIVVVNHGGTNPNVYLWANHDDLSQWADELALLVTGSSGVITRVATAGQSIDQYAGGDIITLDEADGLRRKNGTTTAEYFNETTDSDPKHVDQSGVAISSLATAVGTGGVPLNGPQSVTTQPGLAISNDVQVAGAANLVLAFRRNR